MQIERWLNVEKERLLRCSHFHVIFTIPSELHSLWRHNRKTFGNLLFQTASESLMQLLDDDKHLGARPGLLLALHTWSQQLTLHPHVHALVTGGGLTDEGQWKSTRGKWLLPKRVLMRKYRGKLRALLLAALERGTLRLPHGMHESQMRSLLNRMGRLRMNVKILERYDHGQGVATYLARYLRGGPMGNRRLVAFRNGEVTFRFLNRRENGQKPRYELARLPVLRFLLRYFQHVPPCGFQMVRRYGLYANTKTEALNAARRHLSQPKWSKPPRPSLIELLEHIGAAETARCPVCQAEWIWEPFDDLIRSPPHVLVPVTSCSAA